MRCVGWQPPSRRQVNLPLVGSRISRHQRSNHHHPDCDEHNGQRPHRKPPSHPGIQQHHREPIGALADTAETASVSAGCVDPPMALWPLDETVIVDLVSPVGL